MPARAYVFASDGKWRTATGDVKNAAEDPSGPGLVPGFAGHKPFQVMIGFAAPEATGFPPVYDSTVTVGGFVSASAFDIVTQARPGMDSYGTLALAERRIFTGTTPNLSDLRAMMAPCDAKGQFGQLSFKIDAAQFSTMADGGMDSVLSIVREEMKARRTGGPGGTPLPPHAISIYHEPAGDAGVVLSQWARMNNYCSNYFSGWTTDTAGDKVAYTAANDVRDMMVWNSIMNGNKWGPNRVSPQEIEDAHPQYYIDTARDNGSVLSADFYDGVPSSGNLADYSSKADRTSMKLKAFLDWHRARNCGYLGVGEWSVTQATTEGQKVWDVALANRDKLVWLNYFNSGQNSKWEWRLILDSYPQTNGWDLSQYLPGNFVEIGGTPETEAKLKLFRRIVFESTLPANTAPF